MKKMALAVAMIGLFAATRFTSGQTRNMFIDHSDYGEIVHVLPSEGAIAATHDPLRRFANVSKKTVVYPPSYGSGKLIDHGGLEMGNAGFIAIYWNSSVANSNKTSLGYATIKAELTAFVNNFPNNTNYSGSTTDDYEIIQQYGSTTPIANTLRNVGVFVDTQATKSAISDASIRSYLAGLFNLGRVLPSRDTIFGVYLPPGMKVTLQGGSSCSSFCGYHGSFNYGGMAIKYAAFPFLDCPACKLSTLSVADMLTIVTSHEIREAVTDPGDNGKYAWYDAAGYEADDKCAWHNLYQMTRGGFWVQPEYSNGGTRTASGFTATYPGPGCVVPNR